jgi:hypothetical protein
MQLYLIVLLPLHGGGDLVSGLHHHFTIGRSFAAGSPTNLLVSATDPHLEQFLELDRLTSKLVSQSEQTVAIQIRAMRYRL